MSQLKIYRASAGSGKTYTLTKEFLFLLYKNPLNYSHTLAVTFTNKATGEMKSRILEKLHQISIAETNDYVDELCKEFNISQKQVRQRAHVLLSYLLHDFSNFSVSTIDSFFQKIIRSFAREAGLESGFKIELNTAKILQKAIDHVLMKVDLPEYSHLKEWLVQFAEQKLNQGKNWNLNNDLNKLGNEIFNELFQLESKEIYNTISNKEWMQEYLKQLQIITDTFENKIKAIGNEGSSAIEKSGLKYDAFTGKSRTPLKYFEKLKKLDKIDTYKAVLKLIDTPEKWGRKDNTPNINDEIANIFPLLNKLLKQAIDLVQNQFEIYNTAKVISQNYFALGIIADIANEVKSICREENIFLIADSSHFLHKIIDQNDTPFIYEKIGTRYQNFMIDEFQDTSKLQWLNFKPLIDNSLSNNEKSLIVGDVKQSIYRWRNSDWNLLDNQVSKDFRQHGSLEKTLDNNWRSYSNIIAFNNTLFTQGAQFAQNDFNNSISEFIHDQDTLDLYKNKISHAYLDVFQHKPEQKKNDLGHIHMQFFKPDKELTYNEQMLGHMVEQIELLLKKGYACSDICVLVRKKGEGETVANALLSGSYSTNGSIIPVISNESLFLGGSSAVNFMMAQIKFLQNPNNKILKADLVLSYQLFNSPNSEIDIEIGQFFQLDSDTDFAKQEYEWINDLLMLRQKPLLELVEILAHKLNDEVKAEQGIFIQAFINCTNQFIKDQFPDLSAFIEWWDEKGINEAVAVPDDQDAIKIMTIHKSKGLEFKAVLVPFCNWKLDTEINSNTIWCRPNQEPFNAIKLLPVTYTQKLKNTIFKEDYFKERLYQYVDSLNLLYVAFTRCCEVLVTYGPTPSKNNKGELKNVSDLIYFIIDNNACTENSDGYLNFSQAWDKENGVFKYGDIPICHRDSKSGGEIESENLKAFSNKVLNDDNIAIKMESESYFSTDNTTSKINYGKIMHEAFEYINTVKDVDNALTKMVFEGKITAEEKAPLANQISTLISQNETKNWFSEDHTIKTENTILTKNGSYRPDRVVITKDEVIVIDYKFGDKEDKKYNKQVLHYISQVKLMGYKEVKGYIWYVTLNKIVNVSPEIIQGQLF
ncbi:Dna2/Cas4 domain-containing protein [Labilibacter sediminis]|nr:Dna2/Cas4 domain-containing protein [Labilibacter sediminis]